MHYLSADLHFQTRRLSLVKEQPGDNNAGAVNIMKVVPFDSSSLTHLMTEKKKSSCAFHYTIGFSCFSPLTMFHVYF